VGHPVGAAALHRGAPRHPRRHRAVGAAVGDNAHRHRLDAAVAGQAHPVVQPVRMALVALAHRPLPVVGQLHRPAGEPRRQGGAGADDGGGVVFAAEAAAHGDGADLHVGQRHAEQRRREAAGAERVLHGAVDLHHAVGARHGHRRLGFQVGMLDERGAERLFHDDVGYGEPRGHVAPADAVVVDHVGAVPLVHQRRAGPERLLRIQHGGERVGGHGDEPRGGHRRGARLGHHHRHHVAVAADRVAGEHVVILQDLAEGDAARHVGGGDHADHAGGGGGRGGVHAAEARVDVVGVHGHGVEQAVELQVVGVAGAAGHLGHGVIAPGAGRIHFRHRHSPPGASGSRSAPSPATSRPRRQTARTASRVVIPG